MFKRNLMAHENQVGEEMIMMKYFVSVLLGNGLLIFNLEVIHVVQMVQLRWIEAVSSEDHVVIRVEIVLNIS